MLKTKYLILILLCFVCIFSCKKYDETVSPTIQTGTISNVLTTTATAQGSITNIGTTAITQHGHCWSSANDVPDYRINQGKTLLGAKAADGAFTSSLTGLFPNTIYYVRSFYITGADTIYGNDIKILTTQVSIQPQAPNVATGISSAITTTTANIAGVIINIGTVSITAYGHCYSSTVTTPTIANSITNFGASAVPANISSNISGLTPNTIYYYRAYATNSVGTAYGTVVTFTTNALAAVLPTVTTIDSFPLPTFGVVNNPFYGTLNSIGSSAITELGHVFSSDLAPATITTTNSNVYLNSGVTTPSPFTANIPTDPMSTLTKYRYRAFATNTGGTAYGAEFQNTSSFKGVVGSINTFANDPATLYRGACTEFNGKLYYGLGLNPNNAAATTGKWYSYDPSNPGNAGISFLADCPIALQFANCFTYNNRIYTIGGIANGTASNGIVVMEYKPTGNSWSLVSNTPGGMWGGHGFLIGSKYYIVGGWTTNAPGGSTSITNLRDRTAVYDLTTFAFLPDVASVPNGARGFGASFVINGEGYVVGGFKNQASPTITNDCYKYNPTSNTWIQLPNLPSSQSYAGAISNLGDSYNNLGYVWSGNGDIIGNTYVRDVCRYDPIKNQWKIINSIGTNEYTTNGIGKLINKQLIFGNGLNGTGTATQRIITYF